ncbi:SEC10/PgrA surface exclusion domain-containing protein [Ligilactobacillus ruminis]|uniref:SEC10/PgrA surface exclusion domain-containing protein n=1 Tax=Ligilactobacillus ruminis TaxID=1623 RepID=UPI001F299552|nr:SEC10/PgrA surface exclusion domain-containing protein [Ligilactobacillus ruminis]MCF2544274.1 SEC10/PgrA surface exclusion domain-containing protein [Ligilactobacillus ruminis]
MQRKIIPAFIKAYNDYVNGGKTDDLENAYIKARHEMLVQLQNDYTLNIKDNEVYFGDEADKNVAVDLNNLSQAVQEDLANFVATLLNDVRDQLGLTPYVGKVVVTKGMLDMSNAIAKNYVADNWDAFHNAHDDSGVQKGAQQFGMKDADENLGSYTRKITNLYDLKEFVKDSLLSQIFDDFHYNTVGHVMSLLGLNYIDDKPSETFFGVSTSYVQGSSNVHFHLIPYTQDIDGTMKYAYWGNGKTDKENEKMFEQAGGKQEINNPYATLQNNLNNAKAETNKAQANFDVAEKSKTQAEKAFLEKQSEMNNKTNVQKQLQSNLNEATISANKAQFDFEDAKNRLETAQNNRTQAQKTVDAYTASVQAKKQAMEEAKAEMEKAKAEMDEAQETAREKAKAVQKAHDEANAKKEAFIKASYEADQAQKAVRKAETDLENAQKAYDDIKYAILSNEKAHAFTLTQDESNTIALAENQLATAKAELEKAKADLAEKQTALENAKAQANVANTELTKAKAELENAKKNLAEKQAYLEKLQNASQVYEKAKAELEEAQKALEKANLELENAMKNQADKKQALSEAQSELELAKKNTEIKQKAYDKAKAELDFENAIKAEQAKLNEKKNHTDVSPIVLKKSNNVQKTNNVQKSETATKHMTVSTEKQAKTSELPQMGDEEKSETSVIGIIMMLFASILAMLGLSDKKKKA